MKRFLQIFLLCLFFPLVSLAQDSNGQIIQLKYRLDIGNSNDSVRYASFSPDGKRVLLVNDNSTQVWSAETGKLMLSFPEKISLKNGFRFAWQPNGTKILQYDSGYDDKTKAYLWNTENGKLIDILNEKQGVEQVEWNKNGDRILSVGHLSLSSPNTKTSFSVRDENGKIIRTEDVNSYSLWLVKFTNDGRSIITSEKYSGRKPVRISDAETGALIKSFDQELRKSDYFNYAVFNAESPDGKFLCGQILDSKGVICRTTAASESPLYYFLDEKQTGDITFLSFSPDSKFFTISKPKKKIIEIINAETGKVKTTLDNPNKTRLQFYAKWIPPRQFLAMPTGDSWSPSGEFFIASNFEKEANIWDTQSGKLVAKLPLIYDDEHDWFVGTLVTNYEIFSFHPSEKILLSVSNKVVRLWKPETGELLQEIKETDKDKSKLLHQSYIARWSPHGNLLMTAADENKSILLWEVFP